MAIRFFESVLLSTFLALVGFGLGHLVGFLVKSVIEDSADLEKIRAVISTRARIERGLDARTRARRAEMAKLDREVKELVRRRVVIEQKTSQSLSVADRLVRIVGEELVGRQRYLALVVNKYIGGSIAGAGLIDPVWASAQEVEVWSSGLAEARNELDKRYPPSFGYTVSSLLESSITTESAEDSESQTEGAV